MNQVDLQDLMLLPSSTVQETVDKVRKYGAAVFPGWCNGNRVDALKRDFQQALDEESSDYLYKISYPAGKAASLMRFGLPTDRYAAIKETFSHEFMKSITERYIGMSGLVNYEIYATHEYKSSVDVAPTHHDKLWSLKFMLYLNDIEKDNAPFGVIPGSAAYAREKFREIFQTNKIRRLSMSSPLYQSMQNSDVPADLGPVVDIIGPAGTLIIFDTDTFHHAGAVSEGKERMILRGHCGPSITYTSVRKNSRQWWRGEKRFNKFDDWLDKTIDKFDNFFQSH